MQSEALKGFNAVRQTVTNPDSRNKERRLQNERSIAEATKAA